MELLTLILAAMLLTSITGVFVKIRWCVILCAILDAVLTVYVASAHLPHSAIVFRNSSYAIHPDNVLAAASTYTIATQVTTGFDAAHRILTKGRQSITSDTKGNTLADGTRTYTWDSENRLAQCTATIDGTTTTSTYTYAADGLRHRSVVGTTTTDYAYDGQSMVQEGHLDSGSAFVPAATYLSGSRGPEYKRDDSTGAIAWYVYDGLGSVVGTVGQDGTYSAGPKRADSGALRDSAAPGTRHGFVAYGCGCAQRDFITQRLRGAWIRRRLGPRTALLPTADA